MSPFPSTSPTMSPTMSPFLLLPQPTSPPGAQCPSPPPHQSPFPSPFPFPFPSSPQPLSLTLRSPPSQSPPTHLNLYLPAGSPPPSPPPSGPAMSSSESPAPRFGDRSQSQSQFQSQSQSQFQSQSQSRYRSRSCSRPPGPQSTAPRVQRWAATASARGTVSLSADPRALYSTLAQICAASGCGASAPEVLEHIVLLPCGPAAKVAQRQLLALLARTHLPVHTGAEDTDRREGAWTQRTAQAVALALQTEKTEDVAFWLLALWGMRWRWSRCSGRAKAGAKAGAAIGSATGSGSCGLGKLDRPGGRRGGPGPSPGFGSGFGHGGKGCGGGSGKGGGGGGSGCDADGDPDCLGGEAAWAGKIRGVGEGGCMPNLNFGLSPGPDLDPDHDLDPDLDLDLDLHGEWYDHGQRPRTQGRDKEGPGRTTRPHTSLVGGWRPQSHTDALPPDSLGGWLLTLRNGPECADWWARLAPEAAGAPSPQASVRRARMLWFTR
jgi:hypothetical protein